VADLQPVDPAIVDVGRLQSWMDSCGLGSGPLSAVQALRGGTQNLLLRFERSGRAYVLRRPPANKRRNSDETMRREARVLAALADTPVRHPRLIAAESDESVLGAAFYLMEPVDGFNATIELPAWHAASAVRRREMGLAFIDQLLALHAVNYSDVGLEGFGRPDGYLERQVARWQKQLDSYSDLDGYGGPEIPHLVDVAGWLEQNRPPQSPSGIIHGDYHLANVMFRRDDTQLAAIVDWELATIGDPLIDLGLVMAMWPQSGEPVQAASVQPWDGFPTIDELVARYAAGSSRDLSSIVWYGVLACYKTGIILEGTYARSAAGLAAKEFGELLHLTTVRLFGRAADFIDSA